MPTGKPALYYVLQSRKFWAAVIGLIFIIVNSVLNHQQIDPNTVTTAVMGIIAAYMGSVALEDGMSARASSQASTTTVSTPGGSDVTVTAPVDATPEPFVPPTKPIIGNMGMP